MPAKVSIAGDPHRPPIPVQSGGIRRRRESGSASGRPSHKGDGRLEAVYEDDAARPTQSPRNARGKAEGGAEGDREFARYAALNAFHGYGGDPLRIWEAEGLARTRLERPKRAFVRLAAVRDGTLSPLTGDGSWMSSEISVTERGADDLRMPDAAHHALLVPS